MSGQYSNDNDSRTLTAGAAAVTLTGVIDGPRNIDAYTKGIPVWAEFQITNTSALAGVSVTVILQQQDDGAGAWNDVKSVTVTLGALSALTGAGEKCFSLSAIAMGTGNTTNDVRLRGLCTGANVVIASHLMTNDIGGLY